MKSAQRTLDIAPTPKRTCTDVHCPFHGNLAVRGRLLEGEISSLRMQGTCIVRRRFLVRSKKYRRYLRRTKKLAAHVPTCIMSELKPGDRVRIGECRPIAKTVSFVVVERLEPEEAI